MTQWTQCSSCGLKHTLRDDGSCPRCKVHPGQAVAQETKPDRPAPVELPPLSTPEPDGPAGAAQAGPPHPPAESNGPGSPPAIHTTPNPPVSGDDGFSRAVTALKTPARRRSWLWLGVASAVAFLLVAVLDMSVLAAIILGVVLFIHELGHWVAMRLSGQRDARIFFLPFFGAVTTATTLPRTAGARVAISLAGPVPGIVFGVILLQLFPHAPLAKGLALIFLYINLINMLPIGFLDGGRVVSTLFLSRLPALEAAFTLLSAIPLGLLFGGRNSAGIMGGLIGGLAVSVFHGYHVAKAALALEPTLAGTRDLMQLSEPGLHALYAAAVPLVTKQTPGLKPDKLPARHAEVMKELFDRATSPQPGLMEKVGFGLLWLGCLGIGWAVLANAGGKLLGG